MPQESRPLIVYSCHRVQTALAVASMLALSPVDVYSLGDDVYLEQVFGSTTAPFYGRYSDSISAPNGSGCRVQIGAPVSGALPTGAATLLAPGAGYPAAGPVGTLSGCTISAFFIPLSGLADGQIPATGRVTTNASRQVASATVDFGGNGHTATAAQEYEVVASCNPKFWLLKAQHQKADAGWQLFQSRRAAGDFRVFGQFDDHELISNLTFASADLTSRTGAGAPWWQSQGGADAMLAFWRTASAGFDLIRQAWYDNPAPRANTGGDIPAGLAGATGVSADDFQIRYQAQDYGPGMTPGGNLLRIIHLDTLSYTSPYNAADDGNGLTGKTKLGKAQVQWLLNQLRDAKDRGMGVVVLSPKDLGNIDNGDSWRGTGGGATGYAGELNYILGVIEAEDLPVCGWFGGDRHQPHVAMFDVRNGSAGTLLSLCPCPLGADPAGLTAYAENIWACRDPDVACFGAVKLLGTSAVRLQIIDAHTGAEMFGADVYLNQRRPYAVREQQQLAYKPKANLVPSYVYVGTWALRPTSGLVINSRAFFTDVGVNGSDWAWDGTYWVPLEPVVLFRGAGLVAAPLATLTGVASGTFTTPGSIPAGMFIKPGMRLEGRWMAKRTGATATGAIGFSIGGARFGYQSMAATNGLGQSSVGEVFAVSAASQLGGQYLAMPGNSASSPVDYTANFANAQAVTIALESANAADSFSLQSYSVTLYP